MWIDKSLVSTAKELNFKIGKDSFFGVYNQQFVSFSRNQQQGYRVCFYIRKELQEIVKGIFQNKDSKKLTGTRFARFEILEDSLIISNIQPGFTTKSGIKNLSTVIKLVSENLFPHQHFPSATTEDTYLIEKVPQPLSDQKIAEHEEKLKLASEKKLDHEKAVLIGFPLMTGGGILAGYFSALMIIHLNNDFNPLAKGILSVAASAIICHKLAGGVNKITRFFIILMSFVGFLCWDLSRLFFVTLNRTGKEFDLSKLIEIYERELFNFTTFGKFAILGLVTIVVYGLFALKRSDRTQVKLEKGLPLDDGVLSDLQLVLSGQKFAALLIFLGFILFVPFMYLATTVIEEFSYVSSIPLVISGLILIVIISLGYCLLTKKWKQLKLGLLGWGEGLDQKANMVILLFFMSLGPAVGFTFLISYFNLKFDNSPNETITTTLKDVFPTTDKLCQNMMFKSKGTDFTYRICKRDYQYLEEGIEVTFNKRMGALNIPYVFNLNVPSLKSLKAFLDSGRTEKDLRSGYFDSLMKYDQSQFFKDKRIEWKEKCLLSPGFYCRLLSYEADFKKNDIKKYEFIKRACYQGQDALACRSVKYHPSTSEEQRTKLLARMKEACDKGSEEFCLEWGWSLARDPGTNRDELIKVFEKSCNGGVKDACRTLTGLKVN